MSSRPRHFVRLALVTLAATLVLFLPFLPPFSPASTIVHPITRIFPFNRGLFEDKVANFWCASDVIVKWRRRLGSQTLVRLATALTALGFLPGAVGLVYNGWRLRLQPRVESNSTEENQASGGVSKSEAGEPAPTLQLLPYALLTSSMSFFLFSFQVHEKTILVPLLPMTLLLSGSSQDEHTFELGMLMNNVAMFRLVQALEALTEELEEYSHLWLVCGRS